MLQCWHDGMCAHIRAAATITVTAAAAAAAVAHGLLQLVLQGSQTASHIGEYGIQQEGVHAGHHNLKEGKNESGRERVREREKQRETERERERDTDREKDRERQRETARERERERGGERGGSWRNGRNDEVGRRFGAAEDGRVWKELQ